MDELQISPDVEDALISQFLEFTSGQTTITPCRYLRASNWDLEQALQLFFLGNEPWDSTLAYENDHKWFDYQDDPPQNFDPQWSSDDCGKGASADDGEGTSKSPSASDRGAVAKSIDGASTTNYWYETAIPANDDNDNDYTYDDDFFWLEDPPQSSPLQGPDVWGNRNNSSAVGEDTSESPAQATADDDVDNDHQGTTHNDLASMYRPPLDLTFKGDLEESKDVAKGQNRWLLVNVQSVEEFDSHRLNRDTWADETVAEIIEANFIFWQVDKSTQMGMKVCNYYRINSFPFIMVIDPITGQEMASCVGLIEPVYLLDKLSRFLDMSPEDHILSLFKKHPLTHEHQHEGLKLKENTGLENVQEKEEARKMPVYPPLPEEPKFDDRSLVCRVGIRLPLDGRRVQRNFLLSDPIQLLWSFCFSQLNEEAKRRPFQLVQGMPGSTKYLEYDSCLSFKESGLANSLISVRLG